MGKQSGIVMFSWLHRKKKTNAISDAPPIPAEALQYNCQNQSRSAWINRAKISGELIAAAAALDDPRQLILADIGCGDGKLKDALPQSVHRIEYIGYDLVPQSEKFTRFDVRKDLLPKKVDIIVVLGVLEYVDDVDSVLTRFASQCEYLVVSHTSLLKDPTPEKIRGLNWRTHLSEPDFVQKIQLAGFSVLGRRETGETVIWLARQNDFANREKNIDHCPQSL